ncbi:MAG: sulfurtransferase TusA family protein [Abditibacteriales bacterium]|nr:sulfurtransferase TusA family protein [Abditibacteriales bacterium]
MENNYPIDREINLRGEVCPYTFVYSKLALEEMEIGQVLKVIVDNDASGDNVPRSLQMEGHKLLCVAKVNEKDWEIVVEKAEESSMSPR